ncbi:CRISPR-associated protein Cas4 [Harryflintia acetispora]|uniref:CRISPR-associated protein Cas4 n=1 Tax=Harryflintia acetispora TaxID=1849041 RepID=UPI00189978CB|nr:CRISPR-associated protein Cas4 [Harryflintia acetispora]
MEYEEDQFLQLSGLQHFYFCRRQWALIHIEHQWAENFRTVDGALMHERAHDKELTESRGDRIVTRGMNVFSRTLGVSGECDVLEFHRAPCGIPLPGRQGLWQPFPVEYKRGKPNPQAGDTLQLCAQALCLEEMLCCEIAQGALYYGELRHRQPVDFTQELRQSVRDCLREMHELYRRGHTPKVKPTKSCNACSLKELCLPQLLRSRPVSAYLHEHLEEEP